MVDSLVDIAYKRAKYREIYEKKHSSETYEKKVLKPYLNTRVSVIGKVRGMTPTSKDVMVTLHDINIHGRVLQHINFFVAEDSPLLPLLEESLKREDFIKFSATVKRYKTGGRVAFGIYDVTGFDIYSLGSEDIVSVNSTNYLTSGETPRGLKWVPFLGKGFNSIDISGFSDKSKEEVRLFDSLCMFGGRLSIRRNSFSELDAIHQFKAKKSIILACVVMSAFGFRGSAEYLSYKILKVLQNKHKNEGIDYLSIYNTVVDNSNSFVKELQSQMDWRFVPLSKNLQERRGIPLVLKLKGMSEYVIVAPMFGNCSFLNTKEALAKVAKDFSFDSNYRVTIYNPVTNKVAKYTKVGLL